MLAVRVSCAQRLAASEVLAASHPSFLYTCILGAQRLAASEVLADAARTPPCPCIPSAQRLAASEVLAEERRNESRGISGSAQRLAASEVLAEIEAPVFADRVVVLNALRHQRFWQRHVDRRRTAARKVLNALRHQRFWQFYKRLFECIAQMCSTPCGIRGFGR